MLQWTTVKSNQMEVTLPLQAAKPGSMTLLVNTIRRDARRTPVPLHAFTEARAPGSLWISCRR